MTISFFLRALAAGAFLLLAAPMSHAAVNPPPPAPDASGAQALVKAGKFKEALTVLRPLAGGRTVEANVLFLIGVAAAGASQQPDLADDEREALLDEAIASLRSVLINRPDLVRVRLELARAFFLKGEDSLARGHFERVLAGKPPAPVVANVQRFLAEIRARRRWTMYLGAAMSPDSNIGGASDERIIYINDLPFRRDAEELTTSGIGVSVWTGGEYQYPLGDRLRLRLGGDLSRQDYGGSNFDQTSVSVHAGPRWLVDRDTEVSLVGNARRRWTGPAPSHDDLGARVEAGRRLTPRIRVSGRASWYRRDHRTRDFLDGPVLNFTLGGSWVILPILRADGAAGYAHERPEVGEMAQRQPLAAAGRLDCPAAGLHPGRQRRVALDGLRGQLVPLHARRRTARGPDPYPARHGPQPGLHPVWLQPATGSDERGAGYQRAALRLQTHPRRTARRAPVLGAAPARKVAPAAPRL